jgi:hypothetical protein
MAALRWHECHRGTQSVGATVGDMGDTGRNACATRQHRQESSWQPGGGARRGSRDSPHSEGHTHGELDIPG